MDLGLSEEQEMLKTFARDFLEKESPEKLVREMEEDERGYTDALLAGDGRAGLAGADDPRGAWRQRLATSWTCACCWRRFGRALVPGPFLSTVGVGRGPRATGDRE